MSSELNSQSNTLLSERLCTIDSAGGFDRDVSSTQNPELPLLNPESSRIIQLSSVPEKEPLPIQNIQTQTPKHDLTNLENQEKEKQLTPFLFVPKGEDPLDDTPRKDFSAIQNPLGLSENLVENNQSPCKDSSDLWGHTTMDLVVMDLDKTGFAENLFQSSCGPSSHCDLNMNVPPYTTPNWCSFNTDSLAVNNGALAENSDQLENSLRSNEEDMNLDHLRDDDEAMIDRSIQSLPPLWSINPLANTDQTTHSSYPNFTYWGMPEPEIIDWVSHNTPEKVSSSNEPGSATNQSPLQTQSPQTSNPSEELQSSEDSSPNSRASRIDSSSNSQCQNPLLAPPDSEECEVCGKAHSDDEAHQRSPSPSCLICKVGLSIPHFCSNRPYPFDPTDPREDYEVEDMDF